MKKEELVETLQTLLEGLTKEDTMVEESKFLKRLLHTVLFATVSQNTELPRDPEQFFKNFVYLAKHPNYVQFSPTEYQNFVEKFIDVARADPELGTKTPS